MASRIALVALLVVVALFSAPTVWAQSARAGTPEWEVAAIRPCVPVPPGTPPQGLVSAGRFHVSCSTVMSLIWIAYDAVPNLILGSDRERISGGPAWIKSDRYDVEAKAEGNPSAKAMEGPMLQALLEDRFKLKIHRVTREIPVYELTVAPKGFKLTPMKEGSCTPIDELNLAQPGQLCTYSSRRSDPASPVRAEFHGRSLDEVSWISAI